MAIESFVVQLGYLAIFVLMIMVGILGFFPPSKIIYVVAGYYTFVGNLNFFLVIIIGGLGHAIGNYVQYELARQKGMIFFKKLNLFPITEVKKLQIAFNKKGPWFLLVGKLLDPIKIFISICAGIARMNRLIFFVIVFIGSVLWAAIFTSLGFFFGISFDHSGFIGLFIVTLGLLVMYYFYKYMNRKEILDELKISKD